MEMSTVRQALLIALSSILLLPVASFGASLEEKVDSLEKVVKQQQQQIDQLERGGGDGASVFKNDKVVVQLYGQLNRALLWSNDGNRREFYNVDNDHSSTRFGLNGKGTLIKDVTLGTKVELEYQSNPSNSVSQSDRSGINPGLNKRHLDIYIDWVRFGKLSIGHGDTASNGTSEVDFSGTSVIGYSSIADFAGGQFFYNDATPGLTGTKIGDVFSNLDGLSRTDRLRYDSPVFSGFMLSGSLISGSGGDIALRYNMKNDQFKLGAAIAHSNPKRESATVNDPYYDTLSTTNGSVSVLLDGGFSFTAALGSREFRTVGRDDGSFIYGKVGYQTKLFSYGKSAFSFDLGQYEDIDTNSDKAQVFGLQAVQKIDDWNTELYAGYRHHSLNRPSHNNINAIMTGLRVKF